jgi:hypothetical protein
MSAEEFHGVTVSPVRRADKFAILFVPSAKVRMEAQPSIHPLSLHDLLWENFTFYI